MPVELTVPDAGESISEVRIGAWRKSEGDFASPDEIVVEIETDKTNLEVYAPISGRIVTILKAEGDEASPGEVIALFEEAVAPPAEAAPQTRPAWSSQTASGTQEPRVMPAARRILQQEGLSASQAQATGPGGRILKEDAKRLAESAKPRPAPPSAPATPPARVEAPAPVPERVETPGREEEPVAMTPLRKIIARNLVAAQHAAALLTTFNEVDMSAVIALRKRYRTAFEERHGVTLGFMSFFVKAAVAALQAVPAVNARIDGNHIVYRKYQDIGIAVGGGKGLVVPVLRNAESMTFAGIERTIADFAARAMKNKLELAELQGGTFTISNGGIYGSMLSTPIVNPPQSGILGMHAIQDRPVAVDGQVVVRPMMYLALTYDHRIVDGREAVTFLRRIKDLVERPERIWLEV